MGIVIRAVTAFTVFYYLDFEHFEDAGVTTTF